MLEGLYPSINFMKVFIVCSTSCTVKPDISILVKVGHFYFGLTGWARALLFTGKNANLAPARKQ